MAQRYSSPVARARMAVSMCPECGTAPEGHLNDVRFWIPRDCDLTRDGVNDRLAQYEADAAVTS